MSKHEPRSQHPAPASSGDRPADAATGAEVVGPEDHLHVPKGVKRTQFFVLLVLSILTLVVFTVGDMISMLGGSNRGRGDTYMSWKHPQKGLQTYSYADFMQEKRQLEDYFRMTQAGNSRAWREQITDNNVAYLLITEQLALENGIDVSPKELARALISGDGGRRMSGFGSKEVYTQFLNMMQVEARTFEAALLRIMRVDRYEDFIAAAFSAADSDGMEKAWKEMHQERAFDLIRVPLADFSAAATAEVPDEAGLKAWYAALSAEKQSQLFRAQWLEEKYKVELASVDPSATAAASGLLERYPRPEGTDGDALAKTYYDTQMHVRFRRETPLESGADERDKLYLPFEEVKAQCEQEARIQASMRDWLTALESRVQAKESFEFAREAQELGLAVEAPEQALTMTEWMDASPDASGARSALRGPFLATAIAQARGSGFPLAPIVEARALIVFRVVDRQAAGAPPFEKVAAEAKERWIEERTSELAVAKLKAVRDALQAPVDEAAFQQAAQAQGLEVVRRDWYDPSREAREPLPAEADPVAQFLRLEQQTQGKVMALEKDQVSEPVVREERAWLVRSLGERDPAEVRIKPSELTLLRMRATMNAYEVAREKILNPKQYMSKYALTFPLQREEEAQAPAGAKG